MPSKPHKIPKIKTAQKSPAHKPIKVPRIVIVICAIFFMFLTRPKQPSNLMWGFVDGCKDHCDSKAASFAIIGGAIMPPESTRCIADATERLV